MSLAAWAGGRGMGGRKKMEMGRDGRRERGTPEKGLSPPKKELNGSEARERAPANQMRMA